MGDRTQFSELALTADEGLGGASVATVECVEGDRLVLSVGAERFYGRCAFSCLVVPVPGDTVSIVGDGQGGRYVTAILERPTSGEIELFSDRPIAVHSAGRVRVVAETDLELEARHRISLRSRLFDAVVERLAAFAKAVSVTSGEAALQSRFARVCSGLVDVAAQRLGVRAEHSHRQIDGVEQVRCGHFDVRAKELVHVRAPAAVVKGRDLVKMDAKQIQIG